MPKTKEEILEALKALEGGEEYVTGFNAILKDANKSSKSLKELSEKIKEFETKNTSLTERYNKVSDFVGLPVDVDDLDVALEELKKKKGGNPDSAVLKSQMNELQRKLKTLTDDNVAKEKLYNDERGKRHQMIRDIALRNSLEANKALNPAITARLLTQNVKILDDDNAIFIGEDGSEVTVDEGVKSFMDKYPDYLANKQVPGAGGFGDGLGGKAVDFNKLSPEEYRKWREKQ